jgi:hypothetical protein
MYVCCTYLIFYFLNIAYFSYFIDAAVFVGMEAQAYLRLDSRLLRTQYTRVWCVGIHEFCDQPTNG